MNAAKIVILLLTSMPVLYAADDGSSAKKPVEYNYATEYTRCIVRFAAQHNCSNIGISGYTSNGECWGDMLRKYRKQCEEEQKKYAEKLDAMRVEAQQKNKK